MDPIAATVNNINFKMALIESRCTSFQLTNYALELKSGSEIQDYEYTLTIHNFTDEENDAVRLDWVVNLKEKRPVENTTLSLGLAVLESSTVFNISDIKSFPKVNGVINFPTPLVYQLLGISISSTRGMLSVKLEGTPFSNALIPLVDMKVFLNQQPKPE